MKQDLRPDHRLVRCPQCGAWTYAPDRLCLRCGEVIGDGPANERPIR